MTMTPAEHYAEAEAILGQIAEADAEVRALIANPDTSPEDIRTVNAGMEYAVHIAQVHATLATVPLSPAPE